MQAARCGGRTPVRVSPVKTFQRFNGAFLLWNRCTFLASFDKYITIYYIVLSRVSIYNLSKSENYNMDNVMLGARLKAARERLGLTQEDLVERLGKKTVASISEYENGKRRLAAVDLPDFARVLGVPISYFYADVLTKDDLEAALMDWFRELPTPRSRDYAYRLIQNVIPVILRESSEPAKQPEPKPEVIPEAVAPPSGPAGAEIKKRKKTRPVK